MLIRIFLIIGCILFCYNIPSGYANEFLQLENLRENCLRSLILGTIISIICRERVAVMIIGVEFILSLCNFYVAWNWDEYGGIFNGYYSTLQLSAYLLELIIMLTWVIFGASGIGIDNNANNNRDLLHRTIDDNRGISH